jgi:anaerobic ribonucleoside-triphosphate reductase activating protein
MFPDNRPDILNLLKRFRNRYGLSKTVWLYTGYTMSEIQFDPILEYVDVVVDGEYKEELRNVNRQWCGSENQVIWRKENGRFSAEPARYDTDTSGEWHEKEKGGCCSG